MQTVVIIIMLLTVVSFLVKLSFHRPAGIAVLTLVCAIFTGLGYDYAASQSKAQIADWLMQPELMLDISVILTVDVAMQIAFCFLWGRRVDGPRSLNEHILLVFTYWLPGLLLFPVLFAVLTELIFSMPGVDFVTAAWGLAAGVAVSFPLLAVAVRMLFPEREIRLELIFLVNLLIAALGIVATVNGRTAAAGTNSVEWQALGSVLALLAGGAIAGYFIARYRNRRKINKLQ